MAEPINLLRDLIERHTGLFFRDFQGLEFLGHRLDQRREKTGCASVTEYHRYLSNGDKAAVGEWLAVVTELSKTTSSFYRQKETVEALVNVIMPRLFAQNESRTIRIWSAACSTGEEPAMIAMALAEAGWFDRVAIEIQASDANLTAIEQARRGLYGQKRINALDPEWRAKYFTREADVWRLNPELHRRIQWSVANLMDECEVAERAAVDVVLCRNVLIYFSEGATKRALAMFGRYLPTGSYFIADTGDHFSGLISKIGRFERQELGGGSIWLKL